MSPVSEAKEIISQVADSLETSGSKSGQPRKMYRSYRCKKAPVMVVSSSDFAAESGQPIEIFDSSESEEVSAPVKKKSHLHLCKSEAPSSSQIKIVRSKSSAS